MSFLAAVALRAALLLVGCRRRRRANRRRLRPAARRSRPRRPPPSSSTSLHVLTVRITSVSCMPTARCNTNAHEVSTHGTLLLGGKGLTKGMVVAFPAAPGAPHRPHLAPRTPTHLSAGPDPDGPQQGPLRAHHGAAQPRTPHQLLRADHRRALRPAPTAAAGTAHRPDRHRGQRHGVRRSGHVDLVRQPVRRRQRRRDRRPGACGRRDDGVREELRRIVELLEPVLARSWSPNCTRTA